jgi:hypothetical protein
VVIWSLSAMAVVKSFPALSYQVTVLPSLLI